MSIEISKDVKNAAIEAIDEKLEEYSKTEGVSKSGKFLRKAAKILHFLFPFLKSVKINKK